MHKQLTALAVIIVGLLFTHPGIAGARPFWTEKSANVEGDRIYFVGVASHAPSVEEGRRRALDAAYGEFSEYVKGTDLKILPLETQMTYEEPAASGFNVYRLMWAPSAAIVPLKKNSLYRPVALERIAKETEDAAHLACGMTIDEAQLVMGERRATSKQTCAARTYLLYGTHWYVFSSGVLQCEIPIQSFSPCDWCTNYQCPK